MSRYHQNKRALRHALWMAQPFCAYCRCNLQFQQATNDHIVPRSLGGPNSIDNIVIACRACNQARRDNPLTSAQVDALEEILRWRVLPESLTKGTH